MKALTVNTSMYMSSKSTACLFVSIKKTLIRQLIKTSAQDIIKSGGVSGVSFLPSCLLSFLPMFIYLLSFDFYELP